MDTVPAPADQSGVATRIPLRRRYNSTPDHPGFQIDIRKLAWSLARKGCQPENRTLKDSDSGS
ncbi:MAG: hypothetical protein L7U83_12125 [Akkermansiaceae bacterium]|nr:hypothetical protein [Akkermansiaceae bacterium]